MATPKKGPAPKKGSRAERVARIIGAVRSKFGASSATTFATGGVHSQVDEVIPTGIAALDHYVLGRGGFPVGRLVELFSEQAGGKTSLALQTVANCQAEGGIAIWVDAEHSLDIERATTFGVDPESMVIVQSMFGEEMAQGAIAAIKALGRPPSPNILVVDSVEAMTPRACIEKPLSDKEKVGLRAQLIAKFVRACNSLAANHRLVVILINQIRRDFTVKFGDPTKTPGGDSLLFYSSVRLQGWSGKGIKEHGTPVGKHVTWKAVKNRMGPPFRKIKARFFYEHGWDDAWTTMNFAKDLGVVKEDLAVTPENVEAARRALEACGWRGKMKSLRKGGDDDEEIEEPVWSTTDDAVLPVTEEDEKPEGDEPAPEIDDPAPDVPEPPGRAKPKKKPASRKKGPAVKKKR